MKSAISSVIARNFGKGTMEEVKTLIPQGIFISFLIGGVCYVATVPFSTVIFEFYHAEGAILTLADDYFVIRALGFPLTLATFSLFGVFRGYQNTYWAMWISLSGTAINVILDFLMVFGKGSFPAMGVEGAAWASVIAQIYMLLAAVLTLLIKLPDSYRISFRPNKELGGVLRMGGNLFIRTFALNICYYLGNRFATSFSDAHIAAHTIAMNIWLFSSFFIDGYANAGNALSGKIIGQGDTNLLYRTGMRLVKISVGIGVALAMVYLVGYVFIVDFFTTDEHVKTIFISFFWLVILSQPINAVAFALDGVFKGLGRAALLRNTLVVGTALVFIPIIYGLEMTGFYMIAIWAAFLCWMMFRAGSLFVIFRRDYRA